MKPIVKTLKNLKRRIVGYRAYLFGLSAEGATKAEAIAALHAHVRNTIKRFEGGTTIGEWYGHTYVVWPTIDGYHYWSSIFSRTTYSVGTAGERSDAIKSVLEHIAKTVWQPAFTWIEECGLLDSLPGLDPGPLAAHHRDEMIVELKSYFNWQRKYADARAAGHNDQTARDWAGGMLRELPELPAGLDTVAGGAQ